MTKPLTRRDGIAQGVPRRLLADVRALVDEARATVARQVSFGLGNLYWAVGSRIRTDILKEKRAEYGGRVIAGLSAALSQHSSLR